MRAVRIAKVGLGVTLGCILAGAAAGMLCLVALRVSFEGWIDAMRELDLSYGFAALLGGLCGLLIGPLAAFGLLRRVPLGRLFGETILGTFLGSVLAVVLRPHVPFGILWFAVGGLVVAVAHLTWRYRSTSRHADRALGE